jgi:hypothetical protein
LDTYDDVNSGLMSMEQAQQDSEAKLLDHIDNMLSKKKKA